MEASEEGATVMGELFSFTNPEPKRHVPPAAHDQAKAAADAEKPLSIDNLPGVDFESAELAHSAAEPPTVFDELQAIRSTLSVKPPEDRRRRRRAQISSPIRIRGLEVTAAGPDEVLTTVNASRNGVLVVTSSEQYHRGMDLAVTFPYNSAPNSMHTEQSGRIARITEHGDGTRSLAIAIGEGIPEEFVDACGRTLATAPEAGLAPQHVTAHVPQVLSDPNKPMIVVMDSDSAVRESIKVQLAAMGYEVYAFATISETKDALKIFSPALVIGEIEGEGLPGFALCEHVKRSPELKKIPVVLLTNSAYPTDYSNAHSLGAVVCMAKPFRPERFAHIVRLLAPSQQDKEQAAPLRAADPSRKTCNGNAPKEGSVRARHNSRFTLRPGKNL